MYTYDFQQAEKSYILKAQCFFMVNADTESLAKTKIAQLSKNDSNQIYTKHVKNHDMNNRFMIYHQNMKCLKSKIN